MKTYSSEFEKETEACVDCRKIHTCASAHHKYDKVCLINRFSKRDLDFYRRVLSKWICGHNSMRWNDNLTMSETEIYNNTTCEIYSKQELDKFYNDNKEFFIDR